MKGVWPTEKNPAKSEIEQLFKMAYYVDPEILRPPDIVNFGIDFHRLKEFGEVRMKKSVGQLRPHVADFWGRMNDDQRAAFLISSLIDRLKVIMQLTEDLESVIGELREGQEGLDMVLNNVWSQIPLGLRERLKRGLGKEWSKRELDANGPDQEIA